MAIPSGRLAAIVAPASNRFAAKWGLQRLWRYLASSLKRDGIALIVAPSENEILQDPSPLVYYSLRTGRRFLSASSADLGKEICVCTTLHHFLATSQYLSIAYYYNYYCYYCDHILGVFRLYRGTRCDQM